MTFAGMHVKWSLILVDRLGPKILTMLEIRGQVLHLARVHLKVPGWLSDLKALLTRKLPMFFSRLNETSGVDLLQTKDPGEIFAEPVDTEDSR